MNIDWRSWGPATTLIVVLVLIVAVAGGVVAVVNPDALSFEDYTQRLAWLAGAVGVLGVGRGFMKGKEAEAAGHVRVASLYTPDGGVPAGPDDADEGDLSGGDEYTEDLVPPPGHEVPEDNDDSVAARQVAR